MPFLNFNQPALQVLKLTIEQNFNQRNISTNVAILITGIYLFAVKNLTATLLITSMLTPTLHKQTKNIKTLSMIL